MLQRHKPKGDVYNSTTASYVLLLCNEDYIGSILLLSSMSKHLFTAYSMQFRGHKIAPASIIEAEGNVPDYVLEMCQQPRHARVALGKEKGALCTCMSSAGSSMKNELEQCTGKNSRQY